ncbi:uncharacterized protein [Amphiura filiformis]|uniref:uncharacterized protein n=1 Tax=Amphiura filiformis TaxID=82378 RepID=UPI003B21F1AC
MKEEHEEDGTIINDKDIVIKRAEEFYQDLYEHEEGDILDVGVDEVDAALKSIKNGKSFGPDEIVAEMLKCGGDTVIQTLANLSTKCLRANTIPSIWKSANVILH